MDAPHREYTNRLAAANQLEERLDQHLDRLGLARLAVFGAGLVVIGLGIGVHGDFYWLLFFPIVVFVGLLMRYDRLWRQRRRARRAARYYQYGLDRLEDRWPGKGHSGRRFLDDTHLYALDLDIFGKGSLFERLCNARTRPGEETLAKWLRAPAEPDEIRARQSAVAELAPRLDLREDIAMLGAEVPPVDFSALQRWGKSPPVLPPVWWRWILPVLALANVVAVLGRLVVGTSSLYILFAFALSGAATLWLHKRVEQVLKPIEPMGRDLFLLAGLLQRLEEEQFQTPTLQELHATLQVEGKPPSAQIANLAWLIDWLNAMKNQFFIPLGLLIMWRTQLAFAVESWCTHSGPTIEKWLHAIGEIEALDSLAGYSYENPEDPFPEITTDEPYFDGEALGHPLLPKDECVRNDVALQPPVQVLVVSGSNMSGKSTLLRTVGTNTVLALAGAPVRASRLQLTPFALGATLRIQDSLLAGKSRFFAEISRVRDILDQTEKDLPVLFLLDELFHGTNSHDRGIGAKALVERLLANNALGLLTTHDLSLTKIVESLGERIQNVHFADQFVEGQMHFDYKMRPGVVPHSNALSLMRAIGLDV